MTTWDSMSDADYAACIDAGRGPGYDPREVADLRRKEVQEGAWNGEPHEFVINADNLWWCETENVNADQCIDEDRCSDTCRCNNKDDE